MSVFNNGYFNSSVVELANDVNALRQAEQAYLTDSTAFVADVEQLGTFVQGVFTNPQIKSFNGDYFALYVETVPAGYIWCNAVCQATSGTAITNFDMCLFTADGSALVVEKQFYAGTQNDYLYVGSSASWVFYNPSEQQIFLKAKALSSAGTGQFALLAPNATFGSGSSIVGSYQFTLIKPV